MGVAWIHRIYKGSVMYAYRPFRLLPMVTALFTVVLASGCAVAPPAAERMVVAPTGTVMTYHRKSSGGLGAYDGKVVWNMANEHLAGPACLFFRLGRCGYHFARAKPVWRRCTVESGRYNRCFLSTRPFSYPVAVGSWQDLDVYPHDDIACQRQNHANSIHGKVESWGDVTVPAGTFKAYKLVWTDSTGDVETRWVNPQEGLATIKRHIDRPATHPQGAGVLDAELISYTLPAK